MKKITLFILVFLFQYSSYSQHTYNRIWGEIHTISNWVRLTALNNKTGTFYINYEIDSFGTIYQLDPENNSQNFFFSFSAAVPILKDEHNVRLDKIVVDNDNNVIIYGRTHNDGFGTPGTYRSTPFPYVFFIGYTFIAKISSSGNLIWCTYFHDLSQNQDNLTIDNNNNIYVLTKRPKSTILASTAFQSTGDQNSLQEYQDVISKLDRNGNHLWSTFYFNENSEINSISASANGLYVYGVYKGANSSNTFFSTSNSFQEHPSLPGGTENATVFLTKFNFNGNRLWSTYFGKIKSKATVNDSSFPKTLVTIDDDAYILNINESASPQNYMSTSNTYLTTPAYIGQNNTLTKFSGNGNREWTTYLYGGNVLQKTPNNELLISGYIIEGTQNPAQLITQNAFQSTHGGASDIYMSLFSLDGKDLLYGSYYGYEGEDTGIIYPVKNGVMIYGTSYGNNSKNSLFSTKNQSLFGSVSGYYWGYLSAFFKHQNLNTHNLDKDKLNFNIFPNPANDFINIEADVEISDNNTFTIFNTAGRKVWHQQATNSYTHQINVSNLSSGVYILQIKGDGINQSHKFIKK